VSSRLSSTAYQVGRHCSESELLGEAGQCPFCDYKGPRKPVLRLQSDPDVFLLECPQCKGSSASRMPTLETLKDHFAVNPFKIASTEEKEKSLGAAGVVRRIFSIAAKIEERSLWALMILAGYVWIVAALKARYRHLWLDEIMGLLIAKLPRTADIWRIVRTGADNQPPAYHLLTRASVHLLGNDAWGLRLPSVAGYLLFCLSLYWFVGRRTSKLYGLLAFIFPCLTGCWYYATEGRPYALVLGCTGLAAVCWQSIAMHRGRKLMLIGLFLALAGTLNLHYYSPLLFAPFVFAELVRTYQRRTADWGVWMALLLPAVALLPYIGILRESRVNSGIPFAYYAVPHWYGSLAEFADQFLGPTLIAFLAIACIYTMWSVVARPLAGPQIELQAEWSNEGLADLALLLGFTLLPIVGIAFSKFATHIFFARYIVGSMFGICGLIIVLLWFVFAGAKEPALLAGLVLCALFARSGYSEMKDALALRRAPADSASTYHLPVDIIRGNLPIVAGGPNEFLDIRYYGSQDLRSRTVYVSSDEFAKKHLAFTFLERMMIGSAPYFGTNVTDIRDLRASIRPSTCWEEHPGGWSRNFWPTGRSYNCCKAVREHRRRYFGRPLPRANARGIRHQKKQLTNARLLALISLFP